ncbi:MAG: glycoside hydrolase family 43 protein [Lachnospiraceae bacterium]|nr:glycoside hydrolase family 43 protein [Lachnospiraceae bacterium]
MNCSVDIKKILDEINIINADYIRGNIYLPASMGGASITWTSSNCNVISDKKIGKLAPGVVTRLKEDTRVILTATVTLGDEVASKDIEVCVLKKPEDINEDDYQGYLFGHFIGEENENSEQIYFAISDDGLNFKDMNNGKPVLISNVGEKGVRDPYLYRSPEGDRFFLVATDLSIYHRGGWFQNEQGYYDASTTGSSYLVLWQSLDLVNWGEPTLIKVAPDNAGMAWAPEMIYNDETGEYIIFFASSIMNPNTKYKSKPNAIYYVATRDFVHYSEPKIFIDNQTDGETDGKQREIIDTTVIKIGEYYYSASKDGDNAEQNGGIRILKNKDLLNPDGWEKVLDLDELGLDVSELGIDVLDNSSLEGPELFQYNRKDWANPDIPEYGIMADQYNIDGGYLPLTTTDIEDIDNKKNSWKLLSKKEYSFDKLKKRHGTIFRITKAELERLREIL